MGIIRKKKKISNIFAVHIILFCISVILTTCIALIMMLVFLNTKYIRPSNFYEKKVLSNIKSIINCNLSDIASYIPNECIYVVYDRDFTVLDTNMNGSDLDNVVQSIKEKRIQYKQYYFKAIDRSDNTSCVVGYTLIPIYYSELMNKYLPNPMALFLIVIILIFISNVIFFSKKLSKRLRKEFELLKKCSKKINMENLEFKIDKSNIAEIDDILTALDKMKNSLKVSLEHQWAMEENKRSRINALAHDIKTPLTIIKGNSELMEETDLNEEQHYFNIGIINESNNIQKYLKCLLDMVNFDKDAKVEITDIKFDEFMNDIWNSASALASIKNIELIKEIKYKPEFINCDFDKFKRVIINIISNACDFCSNPGKVILNIDADDKNIIFTVSDNGRGFSNECIAHGTEQFYQEDKSRNSKNHYGMGLYICKKIVLLHKGTITLTNSKILGGGEVVVKIPQKNKNK